MVIGKKMFQNKLVSAQVLSSHTPHRNWARPRQCVPPVGGRIVHVCCTCLCSWSKSPLHAPLWDIIYKRSWSLEAHEDKIWKIPYTSCALVHLGTFWSAVAYRSKDQLTLSDAGVWRPKTQFCQMYVTWLVQLTFMRWLSFHSGHESSIDRNTVLPSLSNVWHVFCGKPW